MISEPKTRTQPILLEEIERAYRRARIRKKMMEYMDTDAYRDRYWSDEMPKSYRYPILRHYWRVEDEDIEAKLRRLDEFFDKQWFQLSNEFHWRVSMRQSMM